MTAERLIDAVKAGDIDTVRALIASDPSLVRIRDADGLSPLMLARYRSDRAVMDALLTADPDLDIFEAAALGYMDRLRERIEEDPARVSAISTDGFTALHLAAFFGKTEAARELIDAGASVDRFTENDLANQPLHAAAAGRRIEVCRLLLAAGADVNARQHGGYTPLHEAAEHGDVEMVELFLSAGADASTADDSGQTPGDRAAAAGHQDLATRLRQVASEHRAARP